MPDSSYISYSRKKFDHYTKAKLIATISGANEASYFEKLRSKLVQKKAEATLSLQICRLISKRLLHLEDIKRFPNTVDRLPAFKP